MYDAVLPLVQFTETTACRAEVYGVRRIVVGAVGEGRLDPLDLPVIQLDRRASSAREQTRRDPAVHANSWGTGDLWARVL